MVFNFSDLVPKLCVARYWRKDRRVLLLFLLSSYALAAGNPRERSGGLDGLLG